MPRQGAGSQMNSPGFVYLFKLDRFYKIGSSADPVRRAEAFANLPWPVDIVHTIASARRGFVEKLLHRRFADRRVRCEWFSLGEHEVARLRAVDRLDSLDDFPEDLLPHPRFWREPRSDAADLDSSEIRLSPEVAELLWHVMSTGRPRRTMEEAFELIARPIILASYQQLDERVRARLAGRPGA